MDQYLDQDGIKKKSIRNIDLQLQAKINISEPQNIDPNQYAMLRARAAAPSSTRVASTSWTGIGAIGLDGPAPEHNMHVGLAASNCVQQSDASTARFAGFERLWVLSTLTPSVFTGFKQLFPAPATEADVEPRFKVMEVFCGIMFDKGKGVTGDLEQLPIERGIALKHLLQASTCRPGRWATWQLAKTGANSHLLPQLQLAVQISQ